MTSMHKDAHKYKAKHNKLVVEEAEVSDGGWGWVVVAAVSYCLGILYGMVNNYALLYNKFAVVYNNTENHIIYAAWTGSLSYGLQCLFCIIGCILVDFFNPRVIGVIGGLISALSMYLSSKINQIEYYILTYGILLSVGQALLLASTLAVLPYYFKKKLSLANGVTNTFASLCCIILPLCTAYIMKKYNLAESFYLLAFLNLVASGMCMTYRSVIVSDVELSVKKRVKQSFGLEVFKKKKYLVWCGATFIGVLGYLIPIVIIDHHSEKAFPGYSPVVLNTAFAAGSGFGSMFFGILGDKTKFNRVHYHTFAYLIYGIVQVSIPYANHFYTLTAMCTLLGVMDGTLLAFIVPITCDLVSSKLANQAAGYYHVVMSPMAIAGPVVAGWLYEIFHNYELSFYIGGASCIICSMILIFLILIPDLISERKKYKNCNLNYLETSPPL